MAQKQRGKNPPIPPASNEDLIRKVLENLGENPDREGLSSTPRRVSQMYDFLTQGYQDETDEILNGALFTVKYDEMVIIRDIEVYSLCEHHLLPFFGRGHVGYLPSRKVIGLSKIPRLVDMFARRLQVQERLTQQIAETLAEHVKPKGVGVIIQARHLCMMMRGVQKQNTEVTTSSLLGSFRDDVRSRAEFLNLVGVQSK
jgi:GTP cyclohydrolase I